MTNSPPGRVAKRPSPPQLSKPFVPMMQGCKWLVLALWGLLPLFCQAQGLCVSSIGPGSIVSTSAMTSRVLVVMRTSMVLTGTTSCGVRPTAMSTLGVLNNQPTTITKNGVTVDFSKVKFRNRGSVPSGCTFQGDGSLMFFYNCKPGNGANGQTVTFDVEYLLEGTSTTSANIELFTPQLSAFADGSQISTFLTSSIFPGINVPKSTAPTCSTALNPTFVNLGSIRPTELSGGVGSFTASGQKTLSLTMTCLANALTQATTFTPSFKFTKLLNSGAFDIALSDGVDPGFGFRVLDPQGTPIKSGAALTNATFAFNTPASVQSISNNFTVQYAKTQTTLNPGVVSATIAITISFP